MDVWEGALKRVGIVYGSLVAVACAGGFGLTFVSGHRWVWWTVFLLVIFAIIIAVVTTLSGPSTMPGGMRGSGINSAQWSVIGSGRSPDDRPVRSSGPTFSDELWLMTIAAALVLTAIALHLAVPGTHPVPR